MKKGGEKKADVFIDTWSLSTLDILDLENTWLFKRIRKEYRVIIEKILENFICLMEEYPDDIVQIQKHVRRLLGNIVLDPCDIHEGYSSEFFWEILIFQEHIKSLKKKSIPLNLDVINNNSGNLRIKEIHWPEIGKIDHINFEENIDSITQWIEYYDERTFGFFYMDQYITMIESASFYLDESSLLALIKENIKRLFVADYIFLLENTQQKSLLWLSAMSRGQMMYFSNYYISEWLRWQGIGDILRWMVFDKAKWKNVYAYTILSWEGARQLVEIAGWVWIKILDGYSGIDWSILEVIWEPSSHYELKGKKQEELVGTVIWEWIQVYKVPIFKYRDKVREMISCGYVWVRWVIQDNDVILGFEKK